MDDLIRRQDAADFLCDWCGICLKEKRNIMECDDIAPNFAKIPSAQQWIPCSEKLPEIGQTVITSSTLGRVREATYKGFDDWTIHGVVRLTCEILSWMPLPEPYEGEMVEEG